VKNVFKLKSIQLKIKPKEVQQNKSCPFNIIKILILLVYTLKELDFEQKKLRYFRKFALILSGFLKVEL
jgi:hypothetical protein